MSHMFCDTYIFTNHNIDFLQYNYVLCISCSNMNNYKLELIQYLINITNRTVTREHLPIILARLMQFYMSVHYLLI